MHAARGHRLLSAHQNGCAGNRPVLREQVRGVSPSKTRADVTCMPEIPVAEVSSSVLALRRVAAWRGIRALAWDGDALYGCLGYQIVRLNTRLLAGKTAHWEVVASFRP